MALTAFRNTAAFADSYIRRLSLGMAASTKIYGGSQVALNASGLAVAASSNTALNLVGRAPFTVDNSTGTASALSIGVDQGIFLYSNSSAGDAITAANIGQTCYQVGDDASVALTSNHGARGTAGTIVGLDPSGNVWVLMGLAQAHAGTDAANLALVLSGAPEQLTSGALAPTIRSSILTVVGTKAFTLAAPIAAGQRKTIYCTAASSTPAGTVTVSSPNGFSTLLFGAAGETIELEADATPKWNVVGAAGSVVIT